MLSKKINIEKKQKAIFMSTEDSFSNYACHIENPIFLQFTYFSNLYKTLLYTATEFELASFSLNQS